MGDLFASSEKPAAEFSPCRTWRYVLRRSWAPGRALGFILLNPSTADETQNDPTIRRCIGYARAWGYGGIVLGNLFALRSTDPAALYSAPDPIGPENNSWLLAIAREVAGGRIICGWGAHGALNHRGAAVLAMLGRIGADLQALTQTKDGHPGHPLYLSASLQPFALGPMN